MNDQTINMAVAGEERPLVTFALFAYNQEKYIREAVEGALAQTYSPLEIILSDDNSSDRTFDIMKEMARQYSGPHKIILNKPHSNLGLAGHVNEVMELAKGELVVVAAGDDISFSDRVSALTATWLEEKKPPAMCSQAVVISDTGEKIADRFRGYDGAYPIPGQTRTQSIKRLLLEDHCILLGCTEAWTPHLFEFFGPLGDKVIHEDNVVSLRAWLLGRIVYLGQPLVKYRTHTSNIAYAVQKVPRSISDFKERELEYAKRQRNKITNLQNHAADIRTAARKGIISDEDAVDYAKIIDSRINIHTIRGMWWQHGFIKRLTSLTRSINRKDYQTLKWGLPRIAGLSVFSGGRSLLAFASRSARRIVNFYPSKNIKRHLSVNPARIK
jgi:glycosyltransferase involved in cell wall biosynthesis